MFGVRAEKPHCPQPRCPQPASLCSPRRRPSPPPWQRGGWLEMKPLCSSPSLLPLQPLPPALRLRFANCHSSQPYMAPAPERAPLRLTSDLPRSAPSSTFGAAFGSSRTEASSSWAGPKLQQGTPRPFPGSAPAPPSRAAPCPNHRPGQTQGLGRCCCGSGGAAGAGVPQQSPSSPGTAPSIPGQDQETVSVPRKQGELPSHPRASSESAENSPAADASPPKKAPL